MLGGKAGVVADPADIVGRICPRFELPVKQYAAGITCEASDVLFSRLPAQSELPECRKAMPSVSVILVSFPAGRGMSTVSVHPTSQVTHSGIHACCQRSCMA